jgi:L-histidine N-alpha-methyltransferase
MPKLASSRRLPTRSERLTIEFHAGHDSLDNLAHDVRVGLTQEPKRLPPKYFYDQLGSQLFDQICDTPEYYQTRTEHALLATIADELVARPGPTHLVELGSGAARKTRVLLDAIERSGQRCVYVPFDVSETMLVQSSEQLLVDYPWLRVHALVADYDSHLECLPAGQRHLVLFLGSTIGNFEPDQTVRLLKHVAAHLGEGDRFLLGVDLVKDRAALERAYNDAQGITADFNKNVLRVINRELDARFDLRRFRHVAFFNESQSQIEMHLEATVGHRVFIQRLGMEVTFAAGERILTEISRKFSRDSTEEMLDAAGLELMRWFVPESSHFALALARRS